MKRYRILEQYWDTWQANADNCTVSKEQIEELATEWEVSVESLMEQVEEC